MVYRHYYDFDKYKKMFSTGKLLRLHAPCAGCLRIEWPTVWDSMLNVALRIGFFLLFYLMSKCWFYWFYL